MTDWKKEFGKRIDQAESLDDITAFIDQLLSKQREELIEEIKRGLPYRGIEGAMNFDQMISEREVYKYLDSLKPARPQTVDREECYCELGSPNKEVCPKHASPQEPFLEQVGKMFGDRTAPVSRQPDPHDASTQSVAQEEETPPIKSAIHAIEEKSRLKRPRSPEDYERFKKEIDAINAKYGFTYPVERDTRPQEPSEDCDCCCHGHQNYKSSFHKAHCEHCQSKAKEEDQC